MDLTPYTLEQDICWRIAARHGLDFYVVDGGGYVSITVEESGYQHPEEHREATGPEHEMWCRIVPPEEQELVSKAGRYQEVPPLPATSDEVYCSVRWQKAVYLSAEDLVALRRLDGFTSSTDKGDLRRGLIGTFSDPEVPEVSPVQVFVSRDVPTGYCLQADGEIEGMNWAPPDGVRAVRPPFEERVDLRAVLGRIRPMKVDIHRDVRVRLRTSSP